MKANKAVDTQIVSIRFKFLRRYMLILMR